VVRAHRASKHAGEALDLDFVNTVGTWRDTADRRGRLATHGNLVA
jgi:hypothetical protein